jgi:hypothetical protein
MKKSLHTNFLLDIALTLFILHEAKVNCGIIVGKAAKTFQCFVSKHFPYKE